MVSFIFLLYMGIWTLPLPAVLVGGIALWQSIKKKMFGWVVILGTLLGLLLSIIGIGIVLVLSDIGEPNIGTAIGAGFLFMYGGIILIILSLLLLILSFIFFGKLGRLSKKESA